MLDAVVSFQRNNYYRILMSLIKDDKINSILIDKENNIWVSTSNNGLIKVIIKECESNEIIR